jgi:hypothetical protein
VTTHPDETVPYYRSHRPRHLPWNTAGPPQPAVLLVGYEYAGVPPPGGGEDTASISFVVRSPANAALALRYRRLADGVTSYLLAGRGTTFYHNMGATVGAAIDLAAGLSRRYDLTPVEAW